MTFDDAIDAIATSLYEATHLRFLAADLQDPARIAKANAIADEVRQKAKAAVDAVSRQFGRDADAALLDRFARDARQELDARRRSAAP